MTDGLFDLPDDYTPPPAGWHPLGKGIWLHSDAQRARDGEGPRCGTCRYREVLGYHNRSYPKCRFPLRMSDGREVYPRDTGCESSDIRRYWPACVDYQPREPTAGKDTP